MMLTLLNISTMLVPIIVVVLALALAGLAALIFLPQKSKQRNATRLAALRLEQTAQRLDGQSHAENATDERGTFSILLSTNELLKALLERQAKQEALRESVVTQCPPVKLQQKQAQELSATAKEIMGLRDRMLLATPKESDMLTSAEVLDIFYQELGEILARENVISLEEVGGRFNQNRQRVIATQVTHNPAQHDIVAKSESPGYLFHEWLLRPQEVVIYKFQEVT
jgi:molecular chaperone GrpE (heat shock protein)